MKKIFLDTEFTGLHQNSTLISLALIAESGEEFYAEFNDFNKKQITEWLTINVMSNCFLNETNQSNDLNKMQIKGDKDEIKSALIIWLNQFGETKNSIQIWADVPHYDWVLFCDLFGGALSIPKQIHYICMDFATFLFLKELDINKPRIELINKKDLPKKGKQHNALYDALITKLCYQKIIGK